MSFRERVRSIFRRQTERREPEPQQLQIEHGQNEEAPRLYQETIFEIRLPSGTIKTSVVSTSNSLHTEIYTTISTVAEWDRHPNDPAHANSTLATIRMYHALYSALIISLPLRFVNWQEPLFIITHEGPIPDHENINSVGALNNGRPPQRRNSSIERHRRDNNRLAFPRQLEEDVEPRPPPRL